MLGQATGGKLKAEKCGVYFMTYEFVSGKARLKEVKDLPEPLGWITRKDGTEAPTHLSTPQPDGNTALIPTVEVTELSKEFGFSLTQQGTGSDTRLK